MSSFNFRSYFNFLGRNKVYTAINFVGFSVALMFVILLGLYVVKENGVDKFHEKRDRLFAITDEEGNNGWAANIGGMISERYPEVESYARFWRSDYLVKTEDGTEIINAEALVTDSTFFTMFSFPMAAGDPARQLRARGDVSISRSFATRLFGDADPIGKRIMLPMVESGEMTPHTVTGVYEDLENSVFPNKDLIVRFDTQHIHAFSFRTLGRCDFPTFVLMREGADLHPKLGEMADWFREFYWIYQNGADSEVRLEPIAESYYGNGDYWFLNHGDRPMLWMLAIASLAVLLFAVINYVNLSVALSGFRAREAAMRRLLGGTRAGLLISYMAESVIFCTLAFVIAIVLAGLFEPTFNAVMDCSVSVGGALKTPSIVAAFLGSAVVLGVVSGIFPALAVTGVKPIDVVKGEFTRRMRMTYSRLFIGLQFCLTMVLIASALTIWRQNRYMTTTDLGFDKEQLIALPYALKQEQQDGIRDRLTRIPGVEMVSFTMGIPGIMANGQFITYPDGSNINFRIFYGDSLYFPTLGLKVLRETGNTADSAVWLNETAARRLNVQPDADRVAVYADGKEWALGGIIEDFHHRAFTEEIEPAIIRNLMREGIFGHISHILIRINSARPAETMRQINAAYRDYNGDLPIEGQFVDDEVESWYERQRRTGAMIGAFAVLAIIISAMGLVAMSTYFMRQRLREIAVRKVFGATSGEVMGRLVAGFMKIVAAAFVVAVPVIWLLMERWLSTFVYRIAIGWVVFIVAGLVTAAIAFVAVYWQSHRAANTSPVETLHK